jgi:outer membrane biosynthesis protein TonB
MKKATAISIGLHVAVLLWATLSYSGRAVEAPPPQALPVEFISEKDFSQMTKGIKQAPKKEKPKQLVEKKDEPKPVERPKAKVAKKEVKAATDKAPPPEPKVKPPEKKEQAKAEPKPPPKIDPIADKLKEQNAKKHEAKIAPKLPPRRPPRPQHKEPKFNADKIAALLNKREPTRTMATGTTLSDKPSLGYTQGNAATLSASEIDALRRRISQCWIVPAGAANAQNLEVVFRVGFRRDGTIAFGPTLVSAYGGPGSTYGPAFAESGKRAILQCQPYTMLKPDHYDAWKDIEIGFKPQDLGG